MPVSTETSQPNPPSRAPSMFVRTMRPLAYAWLKLGGWTMVGTMPDIPKFVIVAAPHKTNWDLPNAIAAGLHYGLAINWMGKDSIFRWPFGGLMRWLGGISIDRSKKNNAVAQAIAAFDAADKLVIVIPPEGTRSDVDRWKSGFYHIAHGAKVPLVLAFIDYANRRVGVAQVFTPTGDYEADLAKILAVYEPFTAKRPLAA
jgi:1-acyl-sn-glycerol-3-phosphate acyltransferase